MEPVQNEKPIEQLTFREAMAELDGRSMERMLANSWLKLFLVIMIMYLC